MKMDGSSNQHGVASQNQGQQQRYCPTPIMAPPPSSPAPPMHQQQQQLVPQPSLSPAPHHPGYYSHHPGYPQPQSQQQSYYQNYSYQSHGQPSAQAPHYPHQQQQQHHQQWAHHSYYQTQSVDVAPTIPQQSPYQTEAYPPQPQSPYPPYVNVQHQQHQQRMHHPHPTTLPPPPPQQQQPQHALMNLSRFVSQQSPCPSPVPMPHSPTTPVPPMGSPHYHQQPNQGHMTPQPLPSPYPQSQTPQGHMSLPPSSNLHPSYHNPVTPLHSQNSIQEVQRAQTVMTSAVTSNTVTTGNAINNHLISPVKAPSSDIVQNSSNDSSFTNVNHNHMLLSNGGGRSESTSPSSSVSSNRALLSPPPTPNTSLPMPPSNNGHMIPVRLQNIQSGARTKASMRRLMQQQQISTAGSVGSGAEDGNPTSEPESTGKKTTSPKKISKKSKKGAAPAGDEVVGVIPSKPAINTVVVEEVPSVPLPIIMNDSFSEITKSTVSQNRRGRKPSKSPRSISLPMPEKETPKSIGRSRRKSSNPAEPPEVEKKSGSPTRSPGKTQVKGGDKKKDLVVQEPVDVKEVEQKTQKTGRGGKAGRKKQYSKPPTKKYNTKKKVKAAKIEPEPEPEKDGNGNGSGESEEEIVETPTRPIRMRAAKEQAKKPEETKSVDRSRQSRAKRGSVSYKEMSTSRSKSPKESITLILPSPTKRSPSPKKSPKSAKITSKTSPRLKDASPSPVRLRQLKEQSPLGSRRESRNSKETEEADIPKRASRKSKETPAVVVEAQAVELEIKTPPSPKKGSKKSKRETTPVRIPSPRLAKEKSASPAAKSADISEDADQQVKTKAPRPRKVKSLAKEKGQTKKAKAKVMASARKRKMLEPVIQPDTQVEEPKSEEPAKKKAKVAKKVGGRQRKGRPPAAKSSEKEINQPDEEINQSVSTIVGSFYSFEADRTLASDSINPSLSLQSETEVESSFESNGLASTASETETDCKKSVAGIPSMLEAGRRSKSPRQSVDVSSGVSITTSTKLDTQTTVKQLEHDLQLNLTPIDNHSVIDQPPTTSNLQLLSDSVNFMMLSTSPSTVKSAKLKKPRNPRPPKKEVVMNELTPEQCQAAIEAEKEEKRNKKRQSKYELKQMEFRQRKANLEVEVAQALLDMKHSPVKVAEGEAPPTTSSQVQTTSETKSKKVTKPRKPSTKPRKRKITLDTLDIDQSSMRPSTPLSSPPLQSTLSPDIVALLPKAKKQPKQPRPKKPRFDTQHPITPTPTILAVPQINGNQGLNFFINSSVSFQNSPTKTGPVKVSKTVIPPGLGEAKSSYMADIESTIASVVSGSHVLPSETSEMPATITSKPKQRPRQKKVVTKNLSVNSAMDVSTGLTKPRRPRPSGPRKKKSPLPSSGVTPEPIVNSGTNQVSPASLTGTISIVPSSFQNSENLVTTLAAVPVKKKRAYNNSNRSKRSPFKLTPKPPKVPTIFVKSPSLLTSNGSAPSTSAGDKDKALMGPSVKVIKGKSRFFRGGEKEDVDTEPPTSKRVQAQYDLNVPWRCCFCNLGPHDQKLGDLFGPYYSEQTMGSGKSKSTANVETWMHGACILWAGEVVLVGSKLHGLEDVLSHSKKDPCTTCGNMGATIGCLKRGCKQAVHFPCAIRKSWKLDEENFHSFCPAHIT